jgi:putative acetyltransferase
MAISYPIKNDAYNDRLTGMPGIRVATEADLFEIAHVSRKARKQNLPYLPDLHTLEQDLKYFKLKVFTEDQIVVADDEGVIIGFCAFKEGWVDHLYILPEHQGRGIGRSLLEWVKARSRNLLQLWVFERNTDARRFYERNGFLLERTTDGSENEEREPAALYVWPPDAGI